MPILVKIVIISLTIMCALAFAQEPQVTAFSFQDWKEQQVLEAQNQMLRTSSRINGLKAAKSGKTDNKESAVLPNSRIKKAPITDSVAEAEKELKRAQESLEAANGLQLDDYINVYLPTLQEQPEALNRLADKLTKEELSEIFKGFLKKGTRPSDAKRNHVSALEGPASSLRPKGL